LKTSEGAAGELKGEISLAGQGKERCNLNFLRAAKEYGERRDNLQKEKKGE